MARKPRKEVKTAPARASKRPSLAALVRRHSVVLFLALVALATLRIASTYTVFNHTIDEPSHLARGLGWIEKGVYTYEQPPLSTVAMAIGPYLAGRRLTEKALAADGTMQVPNDFQQGALILYGDGHYDRNLTLARLGVLPFFWIAALVVYLWGRKFFGDVVAIFAVFLFTFVPSVLAHAGLATTDMALTAFAGACFFTALLWVEKPDMRRSVLFGACGGLAILAKFSAFLFLPAAFAAALVWHFAAARPGDAANLPAYARERALPALLAAAVAILIVAAGYRFSLGGLFTGLRELTGHNAKGHPAYLLGMRSEFGWWYYYPVVLAVKTPLPFLALLAAGAVACFRRFRSENAGSGLPLIFSLGILLSALFSNINIGVRHILPVYIGFSLTAAIAAVRLLEAAPRARWAGWTLAALLLWHGATSALAHPDYIPYTNALAGDEPEKILVDSDLDWGQDMKRLGRRLQELGARQVAFNPLIMGYLQVHGFPPVVPMDPTAPSPGWNAASLTVMKAERLGLGDEHPEIQLWTDKIKPTERLGKTTLLWYFPPQP